MNFKINGLEISSVNCKNELKKGIEDDGQTVNKIVITREYENKKYNVKGYNYYVLKNLNELEQITTTNNFIYEVIQCNKPVKPYLDIDLKRTKGCQINKKMLLNELLEVYTRTFKRSFGVDIESKDFVILDSSNSEKISFHIIVNTGNYFINNEQQKEYIK